MNLNTSFISNVANTHIFTENKKLAKQYVVQGKLSNENYNKLVESDKTPTKKYVGWMAKQFISNNEITIDDLRNTIEEFDTFVRRNITKHKDLNQYASFDELKTEIDKLNSSANSLSLKELENDYEIVLDNSDLLIATPHTHEASRKLGLTHFSFRSCDSGNKDSAWCTTYKAPNHFNEYYYKHNVTFYYIKIKSSRLWNKINTAFHNPAMIVVALAVIEGYDKIDGYDGLDHQLSNDDITKYTKIIGIS